MEMIRADCPELALENVVCVFGMSQEGKCQVGITVPVLSEAEQRQEGPVLLHLHAWPGPGLWAQGEEEACWLSAGYET